MDSETIDLIITSPPYDHLRDYEGDTFDFESVAHECYNVLKEGGIMVWVVGDATIDGSESLTSFKQAIYFVEKCGFKLYDTMIYEKSNFTNPSNKRYHQIFEYMFILSKGKPKTFNPIKDRKNVTANQRRRTSGKRLKNGEYVKTTYKKTKYNVATEFGQRHNIWRYKTGKNLSTKDQIAFQHPAIFPEALAKDHIVSWSNKGDIILDPFNGSGTTTKMAHRLERRSIGIDISKEYCKIAKKRCSQNFLI